MSAQGASVYATLRAQGSGEGVVGIAAGVWSSFRLSRHARHFYAPSLPALADPKQAEVALIAWRA